MGIKNTAVKVENIGKCYRIGVKEKAHDSFAMAAYSFLKSPLENYRKFRSLYNFDDINTAQGSQSGHDSPDIIWALRDVSFEVERGGSVGIIGVNGAGKSTLLKILSRITPPTTGRAEIHGRVSSLLEVGTGFHQELTGRENVYLNGTVLGMRKHEVDRKFDEIVEFSGVERFLDTPVKRYSSGMTVRLAFSVAAHLEPEILIVDEVLAVGDISFQRKCLKKMEDVGKEGQTVLFVSHNMQAISRLCQKAILLDGGVVKDEGLAHDVVGRYLNAGQGVPAAREWPDPSTAPGGEVARLRAVRIISKEGETKNNIDVRCDVGIEMEYEVLKPGFVLLPHFYIHREEGEIIFGTLDLDPDWYQRPRPVGHYVSTAWIPGNFLAEGMHFITCYMITRHPVIVQFSGEQIIAFSVTDSVGEGTARGDWGGDFAGVVRPLLNWTTLYDAAG